MNQLDLADASAVPYVFGALEDYYAPTSMSQTIREGFTSSLEHLSDFGSNLPMLDAVNDKAFTLAPTSTQTFTNLTTTPNYAYTVSDQPFDFEHRLTLPRHRTSPILCLWGLPHVRHTPTSVTILRAHRIQKLS